MPLVLAIGFGMFFKSGKVVLVEVTLFSFALAFIAELSRMKDMLACSKDVNVFFKRMGDGFSKVVILILAASTMVASLKTMGLIDTISNALNNMEISGTGLRLGFSWIIALLNWPMCQLRALKWTFSALFFNLKCTKDCRLGQSFKSDVRPEWHQWEGLSLGRY